MRNNMIAEFCFGGTSVTGTGPHGNTCIVMRLPVVCFITLRLFLCKEVVSCGLHVTCQAF